VAVVRAVLWIVRGALTLLAGVDRSLRAVDSLEDEAE